ncbi:hypothetical protein Bbelb_230570 [Branchiostoma belcheri]|nr:hypothetical protein Bbelb_230570 [Branchiostoma belcheri]
MSKGRIRTRDLLVLSRMLCRYATRPHDGTSLVGRKHFAALPKPGRGYLSVTDERQSQLSLLSSGDHLLQHLSHQDGGIVRPDGRGGSRSARMACSALSAHHTSPPTSAKMSASTRLREAETIREDCGSDWRVVMGGSYGQPGDFPPVIARDCSGENTRPHLNQPAPPCRFALRRERMGDDSATKARGRVVPWIRPAYTNSRHAVVDFAPELRRPLHQAILVQSAVTSCLNVVTLSVHTPLD